jgi:hypothetical protein
MRRSGETVAFDINALLRDQNEVLRTIGALVSAAAGLVGLLMRTPAGRVLGGLGIAGAVPLTFLTLHFAVNPPAASAAMATTDASSSALGASVAVSATTEATAAPVTETLYVKRDAPLYLEPSIRAATQGEMKRGQPVTGVVDGAGGERFLKFTDNGRDFYLARASLSPEQRPAITEVAPRYQKMLAYGEVYEAPGDGHVVQKLDPGTNITVMGRTDDGWYEILLGPRDVGYMRLADGDAGPRDDTTPPF